MWRNSTSQAQTLLFVGKNKTILYCYTHLLEFWLFGCQLGNFLCPPIYTLLS